MEIIEVENLNLNTPYFEAVTEKKNKSRNIKIKEQDKSKRKRQGNTAFNRQTW